MEILGAESRTSRTQYRVRGRIMPVAIADPNGGFTADRVDVTMNGQANGSAFPAGDTSIRRLEDLGEGQANQFAMAKAIASGDERLVQKAGLEADIARLERLRAAHDDDQYAVRRQMRDAERDIDVSTRRIGEIGQDIGRLVPTAGDAFAMTVLGKVHHERKEAGRALMKEILTLLQLQQEGEVHLASIGGFDLVYEGERFGKGDGYRYVTTLERTGADYEIDLADDR